MIEEPKDMPQDYRLRERLGFRLSRLSRIMQEQLESGLAQHDLTRLKWCVLSGVALEGHTAPSELADHIGVTRPVISRLLKGMIADGLIARSLRDEDGRGREIHVTALGQQKIEACRPIVDHNQAHFVDKLTRTQREQLDQVIEALIAGEDLRLKKL